MTRGRKRKNGNREPNGQLSRKASEKQARAKAALTLTEKDTLSVARQARQRVFRVSGEDALDPAAATVVGRLYLTKQITMRQYNAAKLYLGDVRDYNIAMSGPKPPNAIDLNRVSNGTSEETPDSIAWKGRVTARYQDLLAVIRKVQQEVRGWSLIQSVVNTIVTDDMELPNHLAELRQGLDALGHYYLLPEEKQDSDVGRLDAKPE
jgi:hypothetical protein